MKEKEFENEHEAIVKKIAKMTDFSEEDVEVFYGSYMLQPFAISTGKKMKKLREEMGLSIRGLAHIFNCSSSFLKLSEEGLIWPSELTAKNYLDFFGVTFEELFGEMKNFILPNAYLGCSKETFEDVYRKLKKDDVPFYLIGVYI